MEKKFLEKLSSRQISQVKTLYCNEEVKICLGSFQNYENVVIKRFLKVRQDQFFKERNFLSNFRSDFFPSCHSCLKGNRQSLLILEYCEGLDLKTYLNSHSSVPVPIAKPLLHDLAKALSFLKNKNLVHTKLNSSKVLLTSSRFESASIKLSGYSYIENLRTVVSQAPVFDSVYQAPEFFTETSFEFKQNVWSLGVIAFEVLVGVLPFEASSLKEFNQVVKTALKWSEFENITEEAKEFLEMMLNPCPDQRADIEQVLNSRFLNDDKKTDKELYKAAIENLKPYRESYFKDIELEKLQNTFNEEDDYSEAFIPDLQFTDESSVERFKKELQNIEKISTISNYYKELDGIVYLVIVNYLMKLLKSFEQRVRAESLNLSSGSSQKFDQILNSADKLCASFSNDLPHVQQVITGQGLELLLVEIVENLTESVEINKDSHETILTSVNASLDLFPSNLNLKTLKAILDSFN